MCYRKSIWKRGDRSIGDLSRKLWGLSDYPINRRSLDWDRKSPPKVKAKGKQKQKWRESNTVTSGAQDVTRLCPAGKWLLKPERNLSTARAPRVGREDF